MAEVPRTVLSSDVEIKGSVKFHGDLIIDGKIEGQIDSSGTLTIGQNAEVKADIRARSVLILGKVQGNVVVEERCELRERARLIGDLHAPRLSIADGATFVGKSEVNPQQPAGFKPEVIPGRAPTQQRSA